MTALLCDCFQAGLQAMDVDIGLGHNSNCKISTIKLTGSVTVAYRQSCRL